jgi:hypothetical protein
MAFTRVVLGWAAVTLLFVVWQTAERRLRQTPGETLPPARTEVLTNAIEALLLTLFAGLWFGSLGSGGDVLLFLLVGALMEIPSRLRSHPGGGIPWKPALAGVVRIVLAGVVLGLVMGPWPSAVGL